MGLDIFVRTEEEGNEIDTEIWHGAYTAFHQYRQEIKKILLKDEEIENFVKLWLAQPPTIPPHIVLSTFFDHSDCDGEWDVEECKQVLFLLRFVFEKLPKEKQMGHIGVWKEKTQVFIDGLELAIAEEKRAIFG